MTDFAQLGIEIDSRDVKAAETDLDRLARQSMSTERQVSRSADAMSAGFRAVAASAARMAAKLGTAIVSGRFFIGAIRDAETLERQLLRMNAVISATGGVAGRTANELERQARELARATLGSVEGIMEAQTRLLTFRNIRGEVFDQAIEASLDLAEAMGTDVTSAAMQLARALEDPVRGVTALTRSGTVFTEQQRDMIGSMVEAGRIADAQRFILAELEAQYGGVAREAAQGLGGAMDSLGQSFQEMGLEMVRTFRLNDLAQGGIEAMTRAVEFLGDNMGVVRGVIIATGIVVTTVYAPALLAAATATGAWVASLITLRGALLATGIGALIVGAGTLIDFLFRLRDATGTWGEALEALGDLADGVWEGIKGSAQAIEPALGAVWMAIQKAFVDMIQGIQLRWYKFLVGLSQSAMANGFDGLAAQLGRFAESAGEALDDTMASSRALESSVSALRDEAASLATEGFEPARAAMARLRAIMDQSEEPTTAAADAARGLADELDRIGGAGGGGGSAGAAADGADSLTQSLQGVHAAGQQLEAGMANAFASIVSGSQSARQAISGLLQEMSRMLAHQAFTSLFGSLFGGGPTLVSGPSVAAVSPAPRPFEGGGFTGFGARVGGVDGRGGFPAILHPNETVIDHTKGQGQSTVRVVVEEGPMFAARVRTEAQGVAVNVTRAGLQAYDRTALPGRVAQINKDPRRRG